MQKIISYTYCISSHVLACLHLSCTLSSSHASLFSLFLPLPPSLITPTSNSFPHPPLFLITVNPPLPLISASLLFAFSSSSLSLSPPPCHFLHLCLCHCLHLLFTFPLLKGQFHEIWGFFHGYT